MEFVIDPVYCRCKSSLDKASGLTSSGGRYSQNVSHVLLYNFKSACNSIFSTESEKFANLGTCHESAKIVTELSAKRHHFHRFSVQIVSEGRQYGYFFSVSCNQCCNPFIANFFRLLNMVWHNNVKPLADIQDGAPAQSASSYRTSILCLHHACRP